MTELEAIQYSMDQLNTLVEASGDRYAEEAYEVIEALERIERRMMKQRWLQKVRRQAQKLREAPTRC